MMTILDFGIKIVFFALLIVAAPFIWAWVAWEQHKDKQEAKQ